MDDLLTNGIGPLEERYGFFSSDDLKLWDADWAIRMSNAFAVQHMTDGGFKAWEFTFPASLALAYNNPLNGHMCVDCYNPDANCSKPEHNSKD